MLLRKAKIRYLLTYKVIGYCLLALHGRTVMEGINPLTAKLFNLNFHPLEIVSR